MTSPSNIRCLNTISIAPWRCKKQADALNGAPITGLRMIMGGTSPVLRQVGQMFQQWVSRIGIELELEMVSGSIPVRHEGGGIVTAGLPRVL